MSDGGVFFIYIRKFLNRAFLTNSFYLFFLHIFTKLSKHGTVYISLFRKDCLLCRIISSNHSFTRISARLKFTSATSQRAAFLSTWPGDVHAPNCDYGFESASKREICEHYTMLTDDQIQDKLEACMNHFFRLNIAVTHLELDNDIENNPIILTNMETGHPKRLLTKNQHFVKARRPRL